MELEARAQGLQEAGRSLPDTLRGSLAPPTPSSWTFGPQGCERMGFCMFSPPACGILLPQPQETNSPFHKKLPSAEEYWVI